MKKIFDKRSLKTEADWQNYRSKQKGIGGSDASAILGLSKYKSPFLLWLEMTGQVEKEPINNKFVEWGNILEPVVRAKFKAETGFKVFQNNFVMCHDDYSWMLANIDGEVIDPAFGGRGVLEIKTASRPNDWVDGVPAYYQAQIQHYLAVMGYEYAYCAVLIGGNDFRYYLIERDEYVIDKIISAELDFIYKVQAKIAPQIGGSEVESKWAQSAYPEAVESQMPLSSSLEILAMEYNMLAVENKINSARMDEIKNRLRLEAKEFKTLINQHVKINMPTIRKVLFDSKRFKEEHPDLYEQYKTKESVYRGFDITVTEETF